MPSLSKQMSRNGRKMSDSLKRQRTSLVELILVSGVGPDANWQLRRMRELTIHKTCISLPMASRNRISRLSKWICSDPCTLRTLRFTISVPMNPIREERLSSLLRQPDCMDVHLSLSTASQSLGVLDLRGVWERILGYRGRTSP